MDPTTNHRGDRRTRGRSLGCCLLLLLTLLAVACGGGADGTPVPARIAEGVTLRYWAPQIGDPRHASDTPPLMYQKLEEVTGIHVVLEYTQRLRAEDQLAELKSAGSLPDIVEWDWLHAYPGGPGEAIDDGTIASLGSLIPTYAPNLFRVLSENPEVAREASTADGRYYAFPDLATDPSARALAGPLFRADWLAKLDLEVPETIDEWHGVLRAFKENPFRSPGSDPEYPFAILTYRPNLVESFVMPYFLESNAFAGAYGTSHGYLSTPEGPVYGPSQPEYEPVLRLLASWYAEGLILPQIAEPSRFYPVLETLSRCGAWIADLGGAQFFRSLPFTPAPMPRLHKGQGREEGFLGPTAPPAYTGVRAAAVSATSPNRKVAVRWLDTGYGDWGRRLYNFGIENTSFRMDHGVPTLDPAVAAEMDRGSYRVSQGVWGGPYDLSAGLYGQVAQVCMPGSAPTLSGWGECAVADPLLVLDQDTEVRARFLRVYAPIRQHTIENVLAFISGGRPLDEFPAFVRELRDLGLDEATRILADARAAFQRKGVQPR